MSSKTTIRMVLAMAQTLGLLVFFSCGASVVSPVANTVGSISGFVQVQDKVYDNNFWTTDAPCPDAVVRINGSGRVTHSDSFGHWTLDSLAPGSYTVTVSKKGYGYHRFFSQFIFPGECSSASVATLRRCDTVEYTILSVARDTSAYPQWDIFLRTNPSPVYFRNGIVLGFSHSRELIEADFDSAEFYCANFVQPLLDGTVQMSLSVSRIQYAGGSNPPSTGDTLYLRATGSTQDGSWDMERGGIEYPFHGPASNTVSIMMP